MDLFTALWGPGEAEWLPRARCKDASEPDLWFPPSERGPATERQIARARAECARCPVQAECLAWSLREGIPVGIFGGLTPEERRELRRRTRELEPA